MQPRVPTRVWTPDAVHDTVAAVTTDPAFRRSLRQSVVERALIWIFDLFDRIGRMLPHGPSSRTLMLILVALLVILLAARVLIAARARGDDRPRRRGLSVVDGVRDPWGLSLAHESEGQYELAAHALYRAVLGSVARQERIRIDASKTSGDYARELRRRGSPAFASFRAFVRRFDRAIYGHGECTAAELTELRALAEPFAPSARAA